MASVEAKIVQVAESDLFTNPMSRRAFLAAAGAAGVSLTLSACGGSSSGASPAKTGGATRGTIYEQVTTLSNDYFVNFHNGSKEFTKALGLDLQVFEDQGNANADLSQIGNIGAKNGKMMYGISATAAIVPGVVSACSAAKIYYSNLYDLPDWYTPADGGDYYVMMQTPPSVGIAKETATRLFKKMGGEGTVIHVPGGPGSTADIQRTAGFEAALKQFPGIKVVTTAPGNWVAEDARKAFANKLPSVSDFKGVFAQNDSEAQGVISVLDAQNIKGKLVTGFDGNKLNIQYVAQGKQFLTSATVGGVQAALSGIAVFDAINGWKPRLAERMLYTQAPLISSANADSFLKEIYSGPLPLDFKLMSRTLHPNDWDPQQGLVPIDPKQFFAGRPEGKYKLNAAYEQALSSGQFDQVASDLAGRWKSGPFKKYANDSVFKS
jgi:ribose transport system substrate-binding protein